jgi:hypothetical protein
MKVNDKILQKSHMIVVYDIEFDAAILDTLFRKTQ